MRSIKRFYKKWIAPVLGIKTQEQRMETLRSHYEDKQLKDKLAWQNSK